MLAPNTILQNRYRVVRKLGQGGMGAIYEAIDQRVSCLVALKETLLGSGNEARAAFQREAALLANLSHPSLPKVTDYFGEGDGEFLVMEFVSGHDLAELLALRDGPFPQQQVLRWGIELLKLLEYLHSLEPPVLHRDIKPSNLKATKTGELFLLDFGLAKGATGQMVTLETDRSVPGYTPVYAPLEQILGHGTDPRTDLYSLGAALYHIVTGQVPVSASARFAADESNQPDPLKLAHQLNPDVAPEVSHCLQKAMALSRKDRYSNAAEMRMALESAARLIDDRDTARKAEERLRETLPSLPKQEDEKLRVADKDVQFTVYAPQKIKPEKNYTVLAFAHLSKRRADAAEDDLDPIKDMKEQVTRLLGERAPDYRDVKESSSQPVPRGGELTFVPVVNGLEFNPPSRSFSWRKSIHREEFDVRARDAVDGQTLNGSMTVFLGSLIIAEVGLTISVDSKATSEAEKIPLNEPRSARRVKQVFASYSHKDEQIVAELAHVAPLFGSKFLMDRTHLEPGEDRAEGLQRLIREADVFQLFWSTNSMRSADTAGEIKYAASLKRPGFILPTYWEEPVPRSPAEGLPPPEIDRLQFYRIYPGAILQATGAALEESRLVLHGPSGAEIYIDDERHGSFGSSGRVILKAIPRGKHILRVTCPGYKDHERVIEVKTGEQVIETELTPGRIVGTASSAKTDADVISSRRTIDASPNKESATGSFETGEKRPTAKHQTPSIAMAAPSPAGNVKFSPSPAGEVECVSCRMRYAAGIKFCARCGSTTVEIQVFDSVSRAPIAGPPPPMQNYQAPVAAKGRRGWMVPIYAGAAMVLFIAVVGPLLFMMTKTRTASSSPPLTSAPPDKPLVNNSSANVKQTGNSNSNAQQMHDVEFATLDGETRSLRDFRGRVVLLHFWTISEASRSEITSLNELQKTYKSIGLTVIGLNNKDSAEQVKQFQKNTPQDYLVAIPGRHVEAQLPATTIPTTYVIDRDGRMQTRLIGVQSRAAFQAAIAPLLTRRGE